ncbi:LysE/ArgO family amino acid transporter [Lactovum miscens]|uniref:L-lysine exporter family protein LysE/ArgO n=1 Tax=Lactovum miscens TaxID=190387 RepID=A0A841C9M1_9LACT|nr:LysE family transporter [Lactovum miscens]MBB5888089.1 L-lysine exporter family protein LysE/ArgO [Lactovum miscens]
MLIEVFKGMLIGFAVISPIGMQNLYVFNSALSNRLRRALVYAFFLWFSDATFEIVAFYGMGTLISTNSIFKITVMFIGGILLIYIAWGILRGAQQARFTPDLERQQSQTVLNVILSSILLVWANPQALIDGSLMLGALKGTLSNLSSVYFIIGVLIATFIWFYGITILISFLKEKLPKKFLLWVNILSGLIVLVYGIYLLIQVVVFLFS